MTATTTGAAIGAHRRDSAKNKKRHRKIKAPVGRACLAAAAAVAAVAALGQAARAQTLYWDTNGATANASAGTTASGNWTAAGTFWSTSSAGTVAPQAWTPGGSAVFSAAANATGT